MASSNDSLVAMWAALPSSPFVMVTHHRAEDGSWWADSPDLPGWSVSAATAEELRLFIEEGVRFTLNRPDVNIVHAPED